MAYLGVPPQSGFITTAKQRITSSTNNYVDLDHSISSLADVIVWVNFVKQDSTNLTLTNSSRITLGATLVASDIVEIAYLGKAVATQTPAVGTVTNDMLSGSIANSKLANSSITLNGSAVSLGGSATVGGDNTPSFEAYLSSSTSQISNDTDTKVTFDTEIYDSDGTYNNSNGRFTPAVAGKYFIYGRLSFDDSSIDAQTDEHMVKVFKNGSQESVYFQFATAGDNYLMFAEVVDLNATDYIEIYAKINNGNGARIIAGASGNQKYTTFGAFKLLT